MNLQRVASYGKFFLPGFLTWLADNRHVYETFERQALAAIEEGRERFSARTILHEMRDRMEVAEHDSGYKINDHHSPDLARVFAILHPQHALLWEYRRDDWQEFLTALGTKPPEPPQRDMFGIPA